MTTQTDSSSHPVLALDAQVFADNVASERIAFSLGAEDLPQVCDIEIEDGHVRVTGREIQHDAPRNPRLLCCEDNCTGEIPLTSAQLDLLQFGD